MFRTAGGSRALPDYHRGRSVRERTAADPDSMIIRGDSYAAGQTQFQFPFIEILRLLFPLLLPLIREFFPIIEFTFFQFALLLFLPLVILRELDQGAEQAFGQQLEQQAGRPEQQCAA